MELHIRVRDGDSLGLTEITMPLRVSSVYNFSMRGSGPWIVSPLGGHPNAIVANTGNTPTTIEFQVLDLPTNWSTDGRMKVVLGVGEAMGVPIEIVPDGDWDGSEESVRILAIDSRGNQREVPLEVQLRTHSWGVSPYLFAYDGDDSPILIHGSSEDSVLVDDVSGEVLEWSVMGWMLPSGSSANGSLNVDGETDLSLSLIHI